MEPTSAPWRVLEPAEPDDDPPPAGMRPTPSWIAIAAVVAAIGVAGAAILFGSRSDPGIDVVGAEGAAIESGGTRGDPGAASLTAELVVEVGGAVARPGVYRLPAGARVSDAIGAAGGYGSRVDVAAADRQLNLAALVRDGDEIRVPARGEAAVPGTGDSGSVSGSSGGAGGGGAGAGAGPIDLNRASAEALDSLPGVGPATAAKIIAARGEQPFASVEDLQTRKVVGPATLEKIRALVTVGP